MDVGVYLVSDQVARIMRFSVVVDHVTIVREWLLSIRNIGSKCNRV